MINLVLIDDGINKDFIINNGTNKFYKVMNGKVEKNKYSWSERVTHASMCLHIINQIFLDYNLIHIQIMEDSKKASVKDLILALSFCLSKDVHIINLSIGSTQLSDYVYLKPIFLKLYKKGIITVAALSNSGYRTVPASMHTVIGVSANQNLSDNFDIFPVENNIVGINFYANYYVKNISNIPFPLKGNSLATPVVTAKIAKAMNIIGKTSANPKDIYLEMNLSYLSIYSVKNNSIMNKKKPSIIYFSQEKVSEKFILNIINILAFRYSIEAVCVTDLFSYDLRIINIKNIEYIPNSFFSDVNIMIFYECELKTQTLFSNINSIDVCIYEKKYTKTTACSSKIQLSTHSPYIISETIKKLYGGSNRS